MTQISNITKNLVITDIDNNIMISQTIMKGQPGLLLLWADFCGHCHHFIPDFQNISQQLNSGSVKFPCLALENKELKKNPNVGQALSIEGFPTLMWVKSDGSILKQQYNGNRDVQTLLKYICQFYHQCVKQWNKCVCTVES